MNSDPPHVSVVVIGRNEGERLGRCLRSIHETTYPPDRLEVVYVDTDSTDDSCSTANRSGAKVIRIKPDRPCAAAARNAGMRAASHELVQFLDGDTIVHPAWLDKAVRAITDPEIACVFGRCEEVSPRASIYTFWAHHDWYVVPGLAESCGGNALFRREALEEAGGFDESLIAGEERDVCYRIRSQQGLKIFCLEEPMVRHDVNMTRFGQYWRRCMRTGLAYAAVGGRYPGMRRWRAARWRNLMYAVSIPCTLLLCLVMWSPWPLVVWTMLIMSALVRNALRLRGRVGSLADSLLYSSHHYLAKLPAALGQCQYWLRSAFHWT